MLMWRRRLLWIGQHNYLIYTIHVAISRLGIDRLGAQRGQSLMETIALHRTRTQLRSPVSTCNCYLRSTRHPDFKEQRRKTGTPRTLTNRECLVLTGCSDLEFTSSGAGSVRRNRGHIGGCHHYD